LLHNIIISFINDSEGQAHTRILVLSPVDPVQAKKKNLFS
jgi:hypothetical protein